MIKAEQILAYRQAYVDDAAFHATVMACFHEALNWESDHPGPRSKERKSAEHEMLDDFVYVIGQYQATLRQENDRLRRELVEARSIQRATFNLEAL